MYPTLLARSPGGTTVGHFSNIQPSNGLGVAMAQFSAEGELYRGRVIITAVVGGGSGSAEVEITDP
jgi:hypothetical protein